MIKVNVVPFTSLRGNREATQDRVLQLFGEIEVLPGLECTLVDPNEKQPEADVTVLLAMGGGIEPRMLPFIECMDEPALILARPAGNALAAALDVLAIANGAGRPGRIVQATEGWQDELSELIAVFAAGARLKGRHIGVIGTRAIEVMDVLRLTIQVRKVWGPRLVHMEMQELIDGIRSVDPAQARQRAEEFGRGASRIVEPDQETLVGAAQIYLGLRRVVESRRLNAVTVKCFDLIPVLANTGCYALARLNEEGIPAGCEADVLSTLGMLFIRELTGLPSFMANPVVIDPGSGMITLAHCTIARNMATSYIIRSHLESGLGVGIQADLSPGPVTIVRLGGGRLDQVFAARGDLSGCGFRDDMCRTQLMIKLSDPETARSILSRPLGNHHLVVAGDWLKRIREFQSIFMRADGV
jgi:L-fucose isomerase-like protein